MGLTVGVIGLGRIGASWELDKLRQKPATHAGSWLKTSEVQKLVICDIDANRELEARKQFQDAAFLASISLESCSPNWFYEQHLFDIVSVATPAKKHKDVVELLLKNNPPKLIFCEKPLATSLEDAKWMVEACHDHKVKLAVNHTRRWDPVWRRVAEEIKASQDKPTMAVGHFTGDIMNVGIHMADLVNWYGLASVAEVFGHRDSEYLLFELDVFFAKKRISVTDNGIIAVLSRSVPSDLYEGISELKIDKILSNAPSQHGATPMQIACNELVYNLLDDTAPACTGEDGYAALERTLTWEQKAA